MRRGTKVDTATYEKMTVLWEEDRWEEIVSLLLANPVPPCDDVYDSIILGKMYLALKKYDKAKEVLLEALPHDHYIRVLPLLADACGYLKEYQSAGEYYEQAYKQGLYTGDSDGPLYFYRAGKSYHFAEQYDKAIEIFEEIDTHYYRRYPDIPSKYLLYWGSAYYETNRLKEAVKILRKALEVNPDCLQTRLYLGHAYYRLGYHETAECFWCTVAYVGSEETVANAQQNLRAYFPKKYSPFNPFTFRKKRKS
jgi:tetratricopeptide (TPR) repeat protein